MSPVEHFYQNIDGYFTFEDFYSYVAANFAGSTWHGVEVGVLNGKSAAFLAVELSNAREKAWKAIFSSIPVEGWPRLDLIDNFGGQFGADRVKASLAQVAHVIGDVIADDSARAASRYEHASLDFVYLDADHAYESIARDIDAWLPKVKSGGVIAGHDFNTQFPGVVQAVIERFPKFEVWRGSRFVDHAGVDQGYFPTWVVWL
jgi:hypothetical protein